LVSDRPGDVCADTTVFIVAEMQRRAIQRSIVITGDVILPN
jgi:hypothetical protein